MNVSLRERNRDFNREATGLKDAALYVFGENLEMEVARVDLAPGVQNRDDRFPMKSEFA